MKMRYPVTQCKANFRKLREFLKEQNPASCEMSAGLLPVVTGVRFCAEFPSDLPVNFLSYRIKQINSIFVVYTIIGHRHDAVKFPKLCSENIHLATRGSTY